MANWGSSQQNIYRSNENQGIQNFVIKSKNLTIKKNCSRLTVLMIFCFKKLFTNRVYFCITAGLEEYTDNLQNSIEN